MSCENFIPVSSLPPKETPITWGDILLVIDSTDGFKLKVLPASSFKGEPGIGLEGPKGDPGPRGPVTAFNYVGEFDPTNTYFLGDVVSQDWKLYISLLDNNTSPLADENAWELLDLAYGLPGAINSIPLASWATVTINYPDNVTIEYADGSSKIFTLTGIEERDADGILISLVAATGVWDENQEGILYSSWPVMEIDWLTGSTVSYGSFAKVDQENIFLEGNTFNKLVQFKGPVAIAYKRIADDQVTIDFWEANKFKMVFTTPGTKNLVGLNLVPGMSWNIAIVVAQGNPSVTLNVPNTNFTGLEVSKTFLPHSISPTTFPLFLETGVHILVYEVFDDGIHFKYAGDSVPSNL